MNDQDLDTELVTHAQGRTEILDRVFPPHLCDDTYADARDALLARRREQAA